MEMSITTTINGREYRIDANKLNYGDGLYAWTAYRKTDWGAWYHIPSWTRSDINRFPKSVSKFAHEWTTQLNAQKA